ncbi:class I SAM-dependent rRNA methyltransferase [Blastopirellula retiformator]|uniref:Ribosomal RNA large subunit methyltransferase I n=1 Tax=Blastopirellula retiformator TaxID=2527970 RepID=A0A5C5VN68_9BACT|nr:class I SAM-dependent rRNA methyltransferase [Blastopirellula retiformator]TWT39345.1 Ribosomal RNA large subunit methyltransferase I [Blastopirellula retiformator]
MAQQQPVDGIPTATLKPRKAQPLYGRHPWALHSAFDQIDDSAANGDIVQLVGDHGRFVAYGVVNRQSRINARLYSWDADQPLTDDFWKRKLAAAIDCRRQLGLFHETAGCRLVYSEADGLSGLIVDYFAGHVVLQINALAMEKRLDVIVAALNELIAPKSIAVRGEAGIQKAEGITVEAAVLQGEVPTDPIYISENGIEFELDLSGGQKTGFYLDQRENRVAAAKYFSGRRVLDMFCYSGGFSLAAAKLGGASEVIGIDGSDRAIELARRNAARNGVTNARFESVDAFDHLKAQVDAGEKYDAVILDPPKFTKTRRNINEALKAYFHVNRQGVNLLNPGGILVTCSCSGNVSREDFQMTLLGVAQKSGRDIQILEQRAAAIDHPTLVTCPETQYLKCFICRVE